MARYRVTVDTGGTFSDFVYLDEETGELSIAKLPSTPDDPSRAILAGIEALLATAGEGADIDYFCHGTTVGTNALLEGKGVKTGLLVTEGFPVINAYLQPILARYIAQLDRRLSGAGIATRRKYVMQSNGGMATFSAAARRAVSTVLSGPAGGVTAGVLTARMNASRDVITFDMGGTSCDVALIKAGEALLACRGHLE